MRVRRGLMVQQTQHLAQLYLDWVAATGMNSDEPVNFMVPRSALDGLDPKYDGIFITISPAKKRVSTVNFTELGVVQAIRGTIGNKDWKPLEGFRKLFPKWILK
jgi:hypothetical protein